MERVDHVVLNVADVERAAAWYERVLGLERRDFEARTGERRTALHLGTQKLNLRPIGANVRTWLTAAHPSAGSDDLCFITTGSLDDAAAHLAACGITVVDGPVSREGALGSMTSLYVRDPDGNLVEIATYA